MTDARDNRPTVAASLVEALIAHGVDTVYGLPGIQLDPLFNALHDAKDRLRFVTARHEQGAAYMALGAALSTGRPQVYTVVPGPGMLNTTAALSTAYATGAPVLCLTAEIQSWAMGKGWGLLHEIPDQHGILERLTKWAVLAEDQAAAQSAVAEAWLQMQSGRPRPTAIACPMDLLRRPVDGTPAAPLDLPAPPVPDNQALDRAVAALARAKRPTIFVGGGARDASAQVTRLSDLLQAPVIASRMGKGVLDGRSPYAFSQPMGHHFWADTDVVVAVGSRMQIPYTSWGVDDGLTVVRIDIDPEQLALSPARQIELAGDAAATLDLVNAGLAEEPKRPSRLEEMQAAQALFAERVAFLEPQISYVRTIREAVPEDGIFVEGMTQIGYAARFVYPTYTPRTYLTTGYQGTLGWAVAAGLGAQMANPDRPVVAVSGDGGFLFTANELAIAAQYDIPLVTVLFNDSAYGNVRRIQQNHYDGRIIGSELENPDFVKYAESFGIQAARTDSPAGLAELLPKALAHAGPSLIEVQLGPLPDPWPLFYMKKLRGV